MADSGWGIRFYHANDYSKDATIDFISNFKNTKSRQLDTVIAFSGFYGLDNYLIWNIHKDLPNYDFSTVALNLRLFLYKNPELPYFQDFYRVRDIRYNPSKSQYTLYAVSETTLRLQARLVDYGVTSLSYDENRTAKQLLEEVLMANNIFYVYFHEDAESTKEMIHYEYRYFDIDPEWTVLDFIEYIANDNKYEWCVTKTIDKDNRPYWILNIGHELKASSIMNATKELSKERDNVSHSIYAMKITTEGSPMEPLANWENELKCVWAKHTAGKSGGISRGCFVPTGMGHLDKYLYLRMLEGDIERHIGYSMLNRRKVRIPSITIGNVLKDEGIIENKVSPYIDEISIQKNPDGYSIREPHKILIDRGESLAVQHQLEKITRWTPYLDDKAGLLLPSLKLDNPPPNSLIFNVDGKREAAVHGGYVYGNGKEELVIPFKEKKGDLRLQLPNGWCLYIKESGETFIQRSGADPSAVPSESNTQIYLGTDGSVKFNGGGHKLSHDTHKHKYAHTHQTGNMGIPIPIQSHVGGSIETDATSDNTTKTEAE